MTITVFDKVNKKKLTLNLPQLIINCNNKKKKKKKIKTTINSKNVNDDGN